MKKLLIAAGMGVVVLFFSVRALERAMMFHPLPYDGGDAWTPPPGTTESRINGLHVWHVAAARREAKALVFYSHGNGGNLTSVRVAAEDMSRRGFEVMLWDYRGYGRSDGPLAGDESSFLADAEAVFARAESRGLPILVWGQSLGTTVSADLCARKNCSALVMESGLASSYEFARTQVTWLPSWLHVFAKFSFESAAKLSRVQCPVLVAHGTADPVIGYSHGRLLFDAVQHRHKRMLTIEGAGHWLAASPGYWDGVASFFDEALHGAI